MSKPLFIWAGGKNKMLKHYIPILPSPLEMSIKSYVEPFFGGGAMLIHMMKHHTLDYVYINDINKDIMSIYSCIKNNYDEFLKRVIDLESQYLPMNTDDRRKLFFDIRHEHAYNYKGWSKPYESGTLYFLMKTGFNGIFQINKNTNNRYGTPCGLLNQKDKIFERGVVKWWNEVLQKVTISSGDWKSNTPDIKDAFYFFDPPYRDSFADYGNSFNDKQLKELINFADKKNKVFICNRNSSDGWFEKNKKSLNIKMFDITYTAGRRKKTEEGFKAKKAKEVLLWHMN